MIDFVNYYLTTFYHSLSVFLCSMGRHLPSSPLLLFSSSSATLSSGSSALASICFIIRFLPILIIDVTSLKVDVSRLAATDPNPASSSEPAPTEVVVASLCCLWIWARSLSESKSSPRLRSSSVRRDLRCVRGGVSRAEGRRRCAGSIGMGREAAYREAISSSLINL